MRQVLSLDGTSFVTELNNNTKPNFMNKDYLSG